ncbi:hypothetical protein MIND_00702700 [Mycena indigotica]|uniref:Glyoxal oxidase n=1 Tax=Mycena indigotica TaxID=2126181 RepID=A0A8H6SP28_9AGAR|nr:uncharacterized protein MIND_00702700 [Mycena indigotica]KAF7301375.1 hypothetical protein MIND_00702700 [Mycena indigotica]
MRPSPLAALSVLPIVLAGNAGKFEDVGSTRVSAMMMFLGNTDRVRRQVDPTVILTTLLRFTSWTKLKASNAEQIKGHSAWGSTYNTATHEVTLMDVQTNTFCSSGMHLPNGSFAVFGGNHAVAVGGGNPDGANWDSLLQDFDGSKAIRILSPCSASDDINAGNCQWRVKLYENINDPKMMMQAERWYSTAEALADGTIVMMGGFTGGGCECYPVSPSLAQSRVPDILRNVPNRNPHDGASLSYEFFPSNGQAPQELKFLVDTSGLNSYPHAFLMASGKMFLQANLSTTLWDYTSNTETRLPDMPNGVIRVYPASGATAMLPMTPANNYQQTVIFCGGSNLTEPEWGNFAFPFVNTWERPSSNDCQRITPEPTNGPASYVQDDNMPVGRTMGQFIILPDGKMLVVNGGAKGTAGYGRNNSITPESEMPFQQSFAAEPVGQPALYDPNADPGKRWTTTGFATSSIARLYHSSAILLPDGAVLIAGSNPNLDVNISSAVKFPTTYTAEKFYPPYFSASVRPAPSGVPSTLSYGGKPFDITIPAKSYSGSSNTAAANSAVNVIRGGWTTHGMNMGQRFLQLNNTYTVQDDGTIILHVAQMPPNANIFQPGPALVFVVVNGIPSNGTFVIIGTGNIEAQPLSAAAVLPASVLSSSASGSASGSSTGGGGASGNADKSTSNIGLIAGIAGGAAAVALLALGLGICIARRRRARIRASIQAGKVAQAQKYPASSPYQQFQRPSSNMSGGNESQIYLNHQNRPSDAWSHSQNDSQVWDANRSNPGFQAYRDVDPDMPPTQPHVQTHYPNASYSSFDPRTGGGYPQQPRY